MQRDWNQTIPKWTGWLVATLAIIAFILSYNALRHVAADYGIPENLSFLWPLLVDFALIVFSMAVLSASLAGQRTVWPWLLVGLFTLATVGFNLIHAPDNATARIVAAVAPVALFLSFETLMGMIKNRVKSQTQTVDNGELAELQIARADLEQALAEMQFTNSSLEIAHGNAKADANRLADELAQMQNQMAITQDDASELLHKIEQLKDNAKFDQDNVDQLQERVMVLNTETKAVAAWNLLNATAKAKWIAQHTNGDRPLASHLADALGCATSTVSRAYEAVDSGKVAR